MIITGRNNIHAYINDCVRLNNVTENKKGYSQKPGVLMHLPVFIF